VGWGEWAKGVALGMYLLLWEHGPSMQVLFFLVLFFWFSHVVNTWLNHVVNFYWL